jgi:hypothetical protein
LPGDIPALRLVFAPGVLESDLRALHVFLLRHGSPDNAEQVFETSLISGDPFLMVLGQLCGQPGGHAVLGSIQVMPDACRQNAHGLKPDALSDFLWTKEIMVRISSASCLDISHSILGSCA